MIPEKSSCFFHQNNTGNIIMFFLQKKRLKNPQPDHHVHTIASVTLFAALKKVSETPTDLNCGKACNTYFPVHVPKGNINNLIFPAHVREKVNNLRVSCTCSKSSQEIIVIFQYKIPY